MLWKRISRSGLTLLGGVGSGPGQSIVFPAYWPVRLRLRAHQAQRPPTPAAGGPPGPATTAGRRTWRRPPPPPAGAPAPRKRRIARRRQTPRRPRGGPPAPRPFWRSRSSKISSPATPEPVDPLRRLALIRLHLPFHRPGQKQRGPGDESLRRLLPAPRNSACGSLTAGPKDWSWGFNAIFIAGTDASFLTPIGGG